MILQATLGELAFETHGFAGLSVEIPAVLAAQVGLQLCITNRLRNANAASAILQFARLLCMQTIRGQQSLPIPLLASGGTGVVVDFGYSATHIVPLLDWRPVTAGIKRCVTAGIKR